MNQRAIPEIFLSLHLYIVTVNFCCNKIVDLKHIMMKIYALYAVALMCCLVSCSSIQTLTFDQLSPATISFPERVRNVAVVNNMLVIPEAKRTILTLGEMNGNGKKSAEMLASALADSKYFNQVMICDSALNETDLAKRRILSSQEVMQLAEELDADIVFSLDLVNIQTERDEIFYPGLQGSWSVIKAKITPVLSLYIPGREEPMNVITKTDSLQWDASMAPSDRQMQEEAASFSAYMLTQMLVPYWQQAERLYYDGGCVEMRDAAVCVRENDWQGAYDLWHSLYEQTRSKKLKVRSAINLALASEMQGDVMQAEKWLKEVEDKIVPGSDEDVVWKFYAGQLAKRIKEFPHLNSQMSRFGNNF